jgi:hypothetical protein
MNEDRQRPVPGRADKPDLRQNPPLCDKHPKNRVFISTKWVLHPIFVPPNSVVLRLETTWYLR